MGLDGTSPASQSQVQMGEVFYREKAVEGSSLVFLNLRSCLQDQ